MVRLGWSSSSQFLIRKYCKQETPLGGVLSISLFLPQTAESHHAKSQGAKLHCAESQGANSLSSLLHCVKSRSANSLTNARNQGENTYRRGGKICGCQGNQIVHGGIGTAISNPHNQNHDRKRDISPFFQDRTCDTSDLRSDISVTVMQDPT